MIKPLNDRILVKRFEEETVTDGGIVLLKSAKREQAEGRVIAVGPGKRDNRGNLKPMDVKEGDHVLFSIHAGAKVKVDGEEMEMMSESDVFCVIEDDND